MFAAAGLAAVLIAFLTVGFQSVKAALADPVFGNPLLTMDCTTRAETLR
jgi:hypothetical protein